MTRKTLMMTSAIMLYGSAAFASTTALGMDPIWIGMASADNATDGYVILASADDTCDDDASADGCADDGSDDDDNDDNDDDGSDDDGGDDDGGSDD